ncbi:Antigenic thaumatin-like protein [Penicillium atrosanguineum]|uniref:Antigenic thaumatin-like protein n=1 Tax=Penicillium atrosanguineum TaxID=1132637 RepID=UPI0023885497|nr:Antigenic thaumatin-like protein [Penicillium atrosanguineum]KAJ5293033.1 Antigenic thaumatin-like protein [Penicillium atrosanguineum]
MMPDCDAEKQPPLNATFRAFSDNPVCAGIKNVNALLLARKLFPHQIQMIAIGGTVGTGLYLGNVTGSLVIFAGAVSTAEEVTGLQVLLESWTEHFPGWALGLICLAFLLGLNLCSVKVYGEVNRVLAVLLKVVTIIVFVIVGIIVNCGATTPLIHILERHISTIFCIRGTENVAVASVRPGAQCGPIPE